MIYQISELEFPKKSIGTFLKGFGSRLDFTTDNNKLATDLFLKYINPNTEYFFWDGDEYADDSFTFLLKKVMKMFPAAQFIACKKEDEFENFRKSWEVVPLVNDIGIYLMPCYGKKTEHTPQLDAKNGSNFYKKVISIMKQTEIICIGGGETLQKEFVSDKRIIKRCKCKTMTTWYIISFDRKSKDGLSMDKVFQIKNNPNRFILEIKLTNK